MLWTGLHHLPLAVLALLVGFLLFAGTIKGILGVGLPTVALPLLSLLLDVRPAVMLLSMPLILSNIPQALEGGRTWQCLRRLMPVLLGMAPGVLVGVHLLLFGHPSTTLALAGMVVVLVAGLTWAAPRLCVGEAHQRPAGLVVGFAGGVMGGLAAMSGPLVFTFLLAKGLRGQAFTKEASLFIVTSSLLLALMLSSSTQFDRGDVAISTLAVVPVVLGMLLGQRLRDHVPPQAFRGVVLALVVLSGLGLVAKALAIR